VTQVSSNGKARENYKSIKSHRLTPNIYLGRDSSRDNFLDDRTIYTKKKLNISKNVQPKSAFNFELDPVPIMVNDKSENNRVSSPTIGGEKFKYNSTTNDV